MKIYVGNMPYAMTEDELRSLFEQYGTVASASLAIDRETRRVRGFGFVEMPDARAAVEQACARAARDAVQARIDTLKTRIRCGDTTQQEAYRLMEECMQLQKLLNGTA